MQVITYLSFSDLQILKFDFQLDLIRSDLKFFLLTLKIQSFSWERLPRSRKSTILWLRLEKLESVRSFKIDPFSGNVMNFCSDYRSSLKNFD